MIDKALQFLGEARSLYRVRKNLDDFVALRHRGRYEYLSLPKVLWGTKSHAFWVLLSVILHKLGPRRLLELGSGRSTIYLSEYAGKTGADLISIDQDRRWVALNDLICRCGMLSGQFVHHVDLQGDGFYSVRSLRQMVREPDFVFVDGPVRRGSTESQMQWLCEIVKTANTIVIDDVHRRHIYLQIDSIANASNCSNRLFHSYLVSSNFENCLCILSDDRAFEVIRDAVGYLGVPTMESYGEDDCWQD